MIMLKLDFTKAYDTVTLPFLFQVLCALGIPEGVIQMVKLLFHDAKASVNINGGESDIFPVQRGVF